MAPVVGLVWPGSRVAKCCNIATCSMDRKGRLIRFRFATLLTGSIGASVEPCEVQQQVAATVARADDWPREAVRVSALAVVERRAADALFARVGDQGHVAVFRCDCD